MQIFKNTALNNYQFNKHLNNRFAKISNFNIELHVCIKLINLKSSDLDLVYIIP